MNSDALVRIARLFKILTLVSSRHATERIGRGELKDVCSCSVKTVQRDIDFLVQSGVPIEYDSGQRSYVLPQSGWTYPVVSFTPSDIIALSVVHAWMVQQGQWMPFGREIGEALAKATSALTPKQRELFASATEAIAEIGGLARDYSLAPVGMLLQAITQRRSVRMLYESRSSAPCIPIPRLIDPYRLDRRDGKYLELQAWCHKRKTVRTFAVDRMSQVEMLETQFSIRPWDPADEAMVGGIRGGKMVEVCVLFDTVAAPFARDYIWSFPAVFTSEPNGRTLMRGQVAGTDGLTKELLRWGKGAMVIGGPELRARMIEEVRALTTLYSEENVGECRAEGHNDDPQVV